MRTASKALASGFAYAQAVAALQIFGLFKKEHNALEPTKQSSGQPSTNKPS